MLSLSAPEPLLPPSHPCSRSLQSQPPSSAPAGQPGLHVQAGGAVQTLCAPHCPMLPSLQPTVQGDVVAVGQCQDLGRQCWAERQVLLVHQAPLLGETGPCDGQPQAALAGELCGSPDTNRPRQRQRWTTCGQRPLKGWLVPRRLEPSLTDPQASGLPSPLAILFPVT